MGCFGLAGPAEEVGLFVTAFGAVGGGQSPSRRIKVGLGSSE